MRKNALLKSRYAIAAIAIGLVISQMTVMAKYDDDKEKQVSPTGVWLVNIVPRNCTTGVPIPNAAFESLWTFHKDGTMLVSVRNNVLTLERTAAHGLWRRDRGAGDDASDRDPRTYELKFVHLRRSVSTGAFAGKQESGGSLVLSNTGGEFTTDGFTIVYGVDGVPVGTPGCSNSYGTRFEL